MPKCPQAGLMEWIGCRSVPGDMQQIGCRDPFPPESWPAPTRCAIARAVSVTLGLCWRVCVWYLPLTKGRIDTRGWNSIFRHIRQGNPLAFNKGVRSPVYRHTDEKTINSRQGIAYRGRAQARRREAITWACLIRYNRQNTIKMEYVLLYVHT